MHEQSLSPAEAAAYVGVDVKTLKSWARAGRVPGAWQTPTGWWKFKREGLDQIMQPKGNQ